MSGQWEVVGKKKDKISKIPTIKSTKEVNKKPVVTIDEVLPKSQLKHLYPNPKNHEEPKKDQEKLKGSDIKSKPQKKEKAQEPSKPKPPKSIESALNSINVKDLNAIYEKTKSTFPDAPIVWLKELVQHLNQKMPVEVSDPIFSNKTQGYPLILASQDLKRLLDKSILDAGHSNTELFFDITLASMATDMAKSSLTLGYKLFLQHIARREPKIAISGLKKHIELKNSYQNRPQIGLSILWAVGQGGYVDLQSGFKVFEELMLPLMQFKNYTRFILKYLLDLIKTADVPITREQYLLVLDSLYGGVQKNIPNDLKKDLNNLMIKLKFLLLEDITKGKLINVVDMFIRKLNTNFNIKPYQDHLCDIIVNSFEKDVACLNIWKQIFLKNIKGSAILLQYIYDNWDDVSQKINNKAFNELLNTVQIFTEQLLLENKKNTDIRDVLALIQKLKDRKPKPTGGAKHPIKMIVFVIFLLASGAVFYDVKQNGWTESTVNKYIGDTVAMKYACDGFLWIDHKIDNLIPGYKKTIIDISEPYVKLIQDLSIISRNMMCGLKNKIVKKYPEISNTVDYYAPGLIQTSQNVVMGVWNASVTYFNDSVTFITEGIHLEKFTATNVQKAVLDAVDTTQSKATEYCHWLWKKVQNAIK